ncbi:MAG: type II restriction endonuclease [Bacteroidales bacterium]|nr:type II restriction endonuclease [Bacteroidales bacterium]
MQNYKIQKLSYKAFQIELKETNKTYDYFIDTNNIVIDEKEKIRLNTLDVLIGKKEDFDKEFRKLLNETPNVVSVFPLLIAISKNDRKNYIKGDEITIAENYTLERFKRYKFEFSNNDKINIEDYLYFFDKVGLKQLYQFKIKKSTIDYVFGVLTGLDSNGRKNRGGKIFEKCISEILESICKKYNFSLTNQEKYLKALEADKIEEINNNKALQKEYKKLLKQKADFIISNLQNKKAIIIEINFFNGTGSKPDSIIEAYIERQDKLNELNIPFIYITDGKGYWGRENNDLKNQFEQFNYIMNVFYTVNKYHSENSYLEEIIKELLS